MSIPNIDVIDKKDELKLSAELPGMDEKDIDVQVSDGMLTLSGEKKHETEEGDKDGDYYMSERSFGSFKRTVRLPDGIDQDKIDAHFKNGLRRHVATYAPVEHPRSVCLKHSRPPVALSFKSHAVGVCGRCHTALHGEQANNQLAISISRKHDPAPN